MVSNIQEVHSREAPVIALITEDEDPFDAGFVHATIPVPGRTAIRNVSGVGVPYRAVRQPRRTVRRCVAPAGRPVVVQCSVTGRCATRHPAPDGSTSIRVGRRPRSSRAMSRTASAASIGADCFRSSRR